MQSFEDKKLGGKNELKPPGYSGWPLYWSDDYFRVSPQREVAASGLYELVRNWRIGAELARERAFLLINLAPATARG